MNYSIISVKCYITKIARLASNGQSRLRLSAPVVFKQSMPYMLKRSPQGSQINRHLRSPSAHPGSNWHRTHRGCSSSLDFLIYDHFCSYLTGHEDPCFCVSQIVVRCQTCRHYVIAVRPRTPLSEIIGRRHLQCSTSRDPSLVLPTPST